jgi:hypothetical protein
MLTAYLNPGPKLGPHEIVQMLYKGGAGTVYEATTHDIPIDRRRLYRRCRLDRR